MRHDRFVCPYLSPAYEIVGGVSFMDPDTLYLLHGIAGIVGGALIAWALSH